MAQNPLPKPTGALLILAGKCAAGLTTYATPLGITQITPASLAADAAALSTAVGDFNATRAGRTAAHDPLQTASAAAKTFLAHGRSVLAAHWGNDYSQHSTPKAFLIPICRVVQHSTDTSWREASGCSHDAVSP